MVRLKDIAERVGVSVMTVSRVLRNSPDISEQTREKVLRAAWEMGYVPDATARGLRTGTSMLVGIALPSLRLPWIGEILEPIEVFVDQSQRDLIIASSKGSSEMQERAVDRLLSRRVEGIWLFPLKHMARPVTLYQRIERQNVRLVYLAVADPAHEASKVVFDFEQQMGVAVEHLTGLGHRQIAFVSGHHDCLAAAQRLDGFSKAVRQALGVRAPVVIEGGSGLEAASRVADEVVSKHRDITALVVDNDPLALNLVTELQKRGVKIPQQLSIVGWGNDPKGAGGPVPLTTISVPWQELGRKAAELMDSLLPRQRKGEAPSEPARPEDVILPGELLVRASTAKPPKG